MSVLSQCVGKAPHRRPGPYCRLVAAVHALLFLPIASMLVFTSSSPLRSRYRHMISASLPPTLPLFSLACRVHTRSSHSYCCSPPLSPFVHSCPLHSNAHHVSPFLFRPPFEHQVFTYPCLTYINFVQIYSRLPMSQCVHHGYSDGSTCAFRALGVSDE